MKETLKILLIKENKKTLKWHHETVLFKGGKRNTLICLVMSWNIFLF